MMGRVKKRRRGQHPSLRYEIVGPVRVYPDGREVCLENEPGREEYRRRVQVMVERQQHLCSRCGGPIIAPTFDHSTHGRKMGGSATDDRVWLPDGSPQNSASCFMCNGAAGSRRLA